MSISVVIPNYNGEKYLENCIDSLFSQSLKADEIIIVDNNSTDRSLDIIDRFVNLVTLIKLDENYGFSVAVNEGIKNSRGKYVVLLNNDTELDTEWLKSLYECIKKDETIFSCCSKMLRYDDRNLIDDVGDEYSILGWARKRGDGMESKYFTSSEEVFSSCAGAAIYRREVFNEIGYFDENFFAYLEDLDISYRAKIYGYKNYFCSEAIVYHIGSATSGSRHNNFKVKLAARNNIFLLHKNMVTWQKVINFIPIFLGIIIKTVYFSRKGLGKSYISGVVEGIRNKKKIKRINKKDNFVIDKLIERELIKNTMNLLKRG